MLFNIEPRISIITLIEIFSNPRSKDKEIIELKNFSDMATVYNVDRDIVNIDLRRLYKMKLPDALIAAAALFYQLTLITRNQKDFERIDDIEIINPHAL